MRILGIDPGLRNTGFGIIDTEKNQHRYVGSGVIKVPGDSLPGRLCTIFDSLREVVDHYQPDVAAIEIVFVNVNPQSTLLLGQARGAAITALVSKKLLVEEYTALQIKKSVVGHGKASKEQVQNMVQRLLALTSTPTADAADALACAMTHAQHLSMRSQDSMMDKLLMQDKNILDSKSRTTTRITSKKGRWRLA